MISPTDQQVHCWTWLKNRLPDDSNLVLEDVTWKYTGRKSRKADLLRQFKITNGVSCCMLIHCLKCLELRFNLLSKHLDENSSSETFFLGSHEIEDSIVILWTVSREFNDSLLCS